MAKKNEGGLIVKNDEYDDLVAIDPYMQDQDGMGDPGIQVLTADQEPDEEEMYHYDTLYADFVEELYNNQQRNAETMLGNSRDLYDGVADVAFNILKAVYQRHDQREGPVPQTVIFGEGGIVHTAVDEVFKFAQSFGFPGSDDQDQYVASHINMMKKVGEFVNNKSDDDAVEEAQDLLIDVEMADPNYAGSPNTVSPEDRQALEDVAYQNAEIEAQAAEEQAMAEGGAPMEEMPPEEMMGPESGGLV